MLGYKFFLSGVRFENVCCYIRELRDSIIWM